MSKPAAKHNSSGRCHYCERMTYPSGSAEVRANPMCMATRDHVNPQRLKGYVPDDLTTRTVTCCHSCNAIKAQHPYQIFIFWRRNTPLELPQQHAVKEFQNFVYALALAGFRASKAMAVVRRKQEQAAASPVKSIAEIHAGVINHRNPAKSGAQRAESLL